MRNAASHVGPDAARPAVSADGLRSRDAAAARTMPDVVAAHTNVAGWFNNATFVLPALGALGTGIAWAVTGSLELGGLAAFLLAVTLIFLPVIWLTWQRTPTSIVVRERGLVALHQGRVLSEFAWGDVTALRRIETLGNVRWRIDARSGDHLSIEGEIADLPTILEAVRRRAGLDEDRHASGGPP